MSDTIKRTILFYKLKMTNGRSIIDPLEHIIRIGQLPLTNEGRYYKMKDGKRIRLDSISDTYPLKFVLGYTRKSDYPLVETDDGDIGPLSLSINAGLFEPTHFVLFKNGIVGIEYNSKGPRPQTFRYFLEQKISKDLYSEIKLVKIFNHDLAQTLSRMGEVKAFEITINRDNSAYLEELNGTLSESMDKLKEISDDIQEITVIFKNKKYSKEPITLPFWTKILSWMNKSEVISNIENCKITAFDAELNETRDFDLMNTAIYTKREVIKMDEINKAVDQNAMFEAIIDSFNSSVDELRKVVA